MITEIWKEWGRAFRLVGISTKFQKVTKTKVIYFWYRTNNQRYDARPRCSKGMLTQIWAMCAGARFKSLLGARCNLKACKKMLSQKGKAWVIFRTKTVIRSKLSSRIWIFQMILSRPSKQIFQSVLAPSASTKFVTLSARTGHSLRWSRSWSSLTQSF